MISIILASISLGLLMTPEERQKTGYEALLQEERSALDQWIEEHFTQKLGNKELIAYLQMNIKDGKELLLDNNSKWIIAPKDREISRLWIFPSPLKILHTGVGAYPYTLINLHTQKSVQAKKLS